MSYLSQALEAQALSQEKAISRNMERIFKHALEEINRGYKPGAISYIKATYPQLWEKIIAAEDRLTETWLVGNAADFKKALDEWRDLNFQGIKFFHDHGEQKPPF